MIILVGPSASGKTEVCKALCFLFKYKKFVTTTTRNKRINELEGIDYNFVSKEDFLIKKENNEFIETVFYNENYYGTEKKLINNDTVLIVEPNGLKAFKNLNDPNIISFFLASDEKIREERMILRGDKKEDIISRLKNDQKEFDDINNKYLDYILDSDNKTIRELASEIHEKYQKKISTR